jgi:hemerythrin-like domain-containing protein
MKGANELGQLLQDDHRRTAAVLGVVEDWIMGEARERPPGAVSGDERRQLEALIALIDFDCGCHFAFEEEVLFPLLAPSGAADMVEMLCQEHAGIRATAHPLRTLAEDALGRGFDAGGWEAFREGVMDLVPAVLFHIQKEEMGLVRRLAALLDADTDRRLATEYRRRRG